MHHSWIQHGRMLLSGNPRVCEFSFLALAFLHLSAQLKRTGSDFIYRSKSSTLLHWCANFRWNHCLQVPDEILHDPELAEALRILPINYNFEVTISSRHPYYCMYHNPYFSCAAPLILRPWFVHLIELWRLQWAQQEWRSLTPEHQPFLNSIDTPLKTSHDAQIHKTIWRIRQKNAKRVALQFPEGLMMYACIISDILERWADQFWIISMRHPAVSRAILLWSRDQ